MSNEKLLQFIWNYQLAGKTFVTTNNEKVEIIHQGTLNTNAGPDFLDARVKIDGTLWAGNIEVHIKASDWLKHKHDNDQIYDAVVLHVVAENDTTIKRKNGKDIPAIVIPEKNRIVTSYHALIEQQKWVVCENYAACTDVFLLENWKERLLVERLEQKVEVVLRWLAETKSNWEQVFFISLCRSLSASLNADNFELLARNIPVNSIVKLKNNLLQIEALLFGMAELLPEVSEEKYVQQLKTTFDFQKHKHALQAITGMHWKFLRTRPANFPTVRIAQLARILSKHSPLFAEVVEAKDIKYVQQLFEVTIDGYWDTHYHFGKSSKVSSKHLGINTINSMIINAAIPVIFAYGKLKQQMNITDKAIEWLGKLPPENNQIISNWKRIGISSKHAADTQALIQLKKQYCNVKRCLDCRIGANLITENMV